MRSVLTVVVALGCWLSAPPAHAHGYCGPEEAAEMVSGIEAFAAGKVSEMPADWGCVEDTIAPDKKLSARMIAACTKVVETHTDDQGCVAWSVQAGAKQLGKLDLFTALKTSFELDPFEAVFGTELIVKLDDPRALPILRERWATAAKDKRASSSKHEMIYRWARWRHAVLPLFASQGGADDKAFLLEQLPATKDRVVARAMRRAIAAIEARERIPAIAPGGTPSP